MRNCKRSLVLGGANHLGRIITHWETHTDKDKVVKYEPSCEVVVRRHHFLLKKDPDAWKDPQSLYLLEVLEEMQDEPGDPLGVQQLMKNAFMARNGKCTENTGMYWNALDQNLYLKIYWRSALFVLEKHAYLK